MRLPRSAHTCRPWRIHEVAPDFTVEDVWALPTPGGPGEFDRLVTMIAAPDRAHGESPALIYRVLFAIRWRLGALLGWDRDDSGVGARVPSLRERLPADLRDGARGPAFDSVPFESVYRTDDEWAAEMANRTVHALMHIGWVPDGNGGYRFLRPRLHGRDPAVPVRPGLSGADADVRPRMGAQQRRDRRRPPSTDDTVRLCRTV
jgi:hypothetical protein